MKMPKLYQLLIWKDAEKKEQIQELFFDSLPELLESWIALAASEEGYYELYSSDVHKDRPFVHEGLLSLEEKEDFVRYATWDAQKEYKTLWESDPDFDDWGEKVVDDGYSSEDDLKLMLEDEINAQKNLLADLFNKKIDRKVLVLADMAAEDGRVFACKKDIGSPSNVFASYAEASFAIRRVFITRNGELRGLESHEDGDNYYRFLAWKPQVTEAEKNKAVQVFLDANSLDVDLPYTEEITPFIGKGLNLPFATT